MGDSSGAKWLIGTLIALLAAGGGIVALLQYVRPSKPSGSGPSPAPWSCKLAGAVYNEDTDTKDPIPNVWISYASGEPGSNRLAKTNREGEFRANCSSIKRSSFPITLEVSSPNWPGITTIKTDQTVPESGNEDAYIYVSFKGIARARLLNTRINHRLNQ